MANDTRLPALTSSASRRRSQSGFAVIETLIFVPMIFLLTFLTLEVVNILRVYETLSWTGEYAVRQASEGVFNNNRYGSQKLRADIREKLKKLPIGSKHFNEEKEEVFCIIYYELGQQDSLTDSDFVCEGTDFSNETSFQPGDFVRVRLSLRYEPIFSGLFSWMFPDKLLTMSSTFDRVISAESATSGGSTPPPGGSTPPPRRGR